MRVLLLIADRGGCGLYRMIMPGRAVVGAHGDVETYVADGVKGKTYRDQDGVMQCVAVQNPNADVVVYQRPMNENLVATIPRMREHGCAVVVEMDDDIFAVRANNRAFFHVHPTTKPHENWNHLLRAVQEADWLTCTTPSIGQHYKPGAYSVVPNYVPRSITDLPRQQLAAADGRLVIGWSGTIKVHGGDLEETRGAVARVVQETGAHFHVVGESEGVRAALGLETDPTSTGWLALPEYPNALSHIDVGIVPLLDDRFNRGKSWLKGLEFASLGIPFVASPTPEYQRLAAYGIGVLARRPRDWYRALTRLATDAAWRAELSERGRAAVREHLLIEQHTDQWVNAWRSALAARRAADGATATG